jgi:hypothetical protein
MRKVQAVPVGSADVDAEASRQRLHILNPPASLMAAHRQCLGASPIAATDSQGLMDHPNRELTADG